MVDLIKYKAQASRLIIGIIFFLGSVYLETKNFLLFHTLMELFCVFISFAMAAVALNTYRLSSEQFGSFLGLAYFFVGFFLLLHTITIPALGVIPNSSVNMSIHFWLASRYMEGISILAACRLLQNEKIYKTRIIKYLYPLITGVLLTAIGYWNILPISYLEGYGFTDFKVLSDGVILILFGISFFLFIKEKKSIDRK
ncbi:MAG: MASE3 domain-containing protein, partial [Thermotaleaceae bacterium]